MEFAILIYCLYLVPLFNCIRAVRVTSEYYEQLPDKIPMHFNWSGHADQWATKNRFSAYMIPGFGFLILWATLGILIFIYDESGHLPDDFNLALWFFTFSLIYLLYSTQLGMIQYSLNKIDNVQPVIKMGLGLLIISSILLVAAAFLSSQPTLLETVMCGGIKDRRPVDERTTFSQHDEIATLFFKMGNVKARQVIKISWINPHGVEHFVDRRFTPPKVMAKYMPWWSNIYIMENRDNVVPGNWRVAVFIDGEKALVKDFFIE